MNHAKRLIGTLAIGGLVLTAGCKPPADFVERVLYKNPQWPVTCPDPGSGDDLLKKGNRLSIGTDLKLSVAGSSQWTAQLQPVAGKRLRAQQGDLQCGNPDNSPPALPEPTTNDPCGDASIDMYEHLSGRRDLEDGTYYCIKVFLVIPDDGNARKDQIVIRTVLKGDSGVVGGTATGGPRPN